MTGASPRMPRACRVQALVVGAWRVTLRDVAGSPRQATPGVASATRFAPRQGKLFLEMVAELVAAALRSKLG